MRTDPGECEDRLGYSFSDRAHLDRALTRKAYALEMKHRKISCDDQEVYSTLGDAVLRTVLIDHLMRHGCQTPDAITQKKRELEREELLASIGRGLGLGDAIMLGIGEEKQGARDQPYVLAETLEAVMGAVFLDGGYKAAQACITRWFKPYLP